MKLLLLVLVTLIVNVSAFVPYYGNDAFDAPAVARLDIKRRGGRVYSPDSIADLNRFQEILSTSLERYAHTKRELQGNRVVRKALPISDKLAPIGSDGSWFSEVEIGKPAQKIQFDIDMTSSDFWIDSTTSVRGTAYWSDKSESYITNLQSVFRDCTSSKDNLMFGDKQFTVSFAHCTPPRASVKTLDPSGGMLGLAHSTLSQTTVPHFFEEAMLNRALGRSMFGIEFKKDDPETGAYLSLGGMAMQHDDPLWSPVKTYGFWQILFKSLMIDGNTVLDNIQGVIDISSPFILAPVEDVRMFYNAISGSQPLANGFWSYPCYEDPKVHIEHSGWLFPFIDVSLGKVKDTSGYCVGPLVEADLGGLWVIGEPFLRGVVSVFDFEQNRVGIRSL
ncbi:aspartic peptidase domain-containing protein [Lipomyces arxii]|uniref:aspartic peptidase domain-containing protein n=1 Tax=Lipomyces arxii TaxID=56418 RepID=UPI0034CE1E83